MINKSIRLAGLLIPKKLMTILVKKTGSLRDSSLSILDTMYVPIELHLSKKDIRDFLSKNNLIDIKYYQSFKWKDNILSKPFMFGENIQNNFSAIKKT